MKELGKNMLSDEISGEQFSSIYLYTYIVLVFSLHTKYVAKSHFTDSESKNKANQGHFKIIVEVLVIQKPL